MSVNVPGNIAEDIRQPILGDSFTWAGIEPPAAKKVIVIHATASQDSQEDGFTMANFHVNNNGWGGIGVHFVVTEDAYAGRDYPGGRTLPGPHVQYVGDLATYRAGVLDNNPGRVHIEISGLFTPGNGVPSEGQLRQTRQLIEFLLAPNFILPSMNYFSQVDFHNHQAIQPYGATACPGWQHPQFNEWFGYLQGGPEPSWWHQAATPAPAPAPAPEPTPPPAPVDTTPEWVKTWTPGGFPQLIVAVPSTDVIDATTGKSVKKLPGGEPIAQIAGTFKFQGSEYVRTQWSADNGKWNGILRSDLKEYVAPTPPPSDPVAGAPVDSIQPPVEPLPPYEEPEVTPLPAETPSTPAPDVSPTVVSFWQKLLELLWSLILIPLRLIGVANTKKKGN